MKRLFTLLADGLGRASRFFRRRAVPAANREITGTKRWMPNAEDITLEEYVQEAVKSVQGRECNEYALRAIEKVPLDKKTPGISGADALEYRTQVVTALMLARLMPLSSRGAVGASQVIPDLVMRIDYHLNGDPLHRGLKPPPPPPPQQKSAFDVARERYVAEASKYLVRAKADEEFLRAVETAGENPVPEHGADEFRRSVLAYTEAERHHPYQFDLPPVEALDEKLYQYVENPSQKLQEV